MGSEMCIRDSNNTIYENVGMPNVLYELQGDVSRESDDNGDHCELHGAENGLLSETEFDNAITDFTNFLYYVGEPVRERRQSIGIWVLAFLGILYMLVFLMGKEFSKDYH